MADLLKLVKDLKAEVKEKDKEIERLRDNVEYNKGMFESVNTLLEEEEAKSVKKEGEILGLTNQILPYLKETNWVRSYDVNGDLINERALYQPKLTKQEDFR